MKKVSIILLSLLSFNLYANDNRKLSENQDFIVPNDAPNGEYVGIIKAYPNIEAEGEAATFTIISNNKSIYSLNSIGLITIADNSALTIGTDTIKVLIQKNDFNDDTIDVSINVLDAATCTYIDGDATSNGTGTRNSPLNNVPGITTDNTILLFKRGSSISGGTVYINGVDNFMAASYGNGALPILQSTGSFFRIYGGCDNPVIRDLEFTTPEPERSSPEHSPSTNQYFTNWGGSVYASSNTGILKVEHCVMHHLSNGISDVSPDDNDGENSSHKWNHIYDIAQEGIFCKLISGTTEISCNKLERINLIWFHDETEQISSGDGIQTYQTHSTIVKHNYVDRSHTGNKFCIIVDTYSTGTSGEGNATEPVTISHNYLKGTQDNTTSILIYGYFLNGVIEKNYGDTCNYFVMTGVSEDITYRYNVIRRGQIRDGTANIYNNIFISPTRCLTNGFGADIFKNNIIILSQAGQIVYTPGQVDDASNNLYNIEQTDMFGTGNSSVNAIEENSIIGDPALYDIDNNKFWLNESSPGIDNGESIVTGTDFYNNKIDDTPDIGISEYFQYTPPSNNIVIQQVGNNTTWLYPNPVSNGKIYIQLHELNEFNTVYIYELNGKMVYKNNINQANTHINHSLKPGIYTVQLTGDNKNKVSKLFVY
jgi:hypothetical protein